MGRSLGSAASSARGLTRLQRGLICTHALRAVGSVRCLWAAGPRASIPCCGLEVSSRSCVVLAPSQSPSPTQEEGGAQRHGPREQGSSCKNLKRAMPLPPKVAPFPLQEGKCPVATDQGLALLRASQGHLLRAPPWPGPSGLLHRASSTWEMCLYSFCSQNSPPCSFCCLCS